MEGHDGHERHDGHEAQDEHAHGHNETHSHTHTAACDTGCCERLEAEGEVAVARLALDGGDLEHAANHVAGAVGTDPSLPEAHEALAELAARVGGPQAALRLFPDTVRWELSQITRQAVLHSAPHRYRRFGQRT